jgi:hypothetical protein
MFVSKYKKQLIIAAIVVSILLFAIVQIFTNPGLRALLFRQEDTFATYQNITAKALVDHECNTDEWHFVITQVSDQSKAPANITVIWENNATQTVSLQKFTGQTAHYATTSNLGSKVKSATTQIYSSWSGQFNLSHGPCGDSPTPSPSASSSPTVRPSSSPSSSARPSTSPTIAPTRSPGPTASPTTVPSAIPTGSPPIGGPSSTPTSAPTATPVVTAIPTPQSTTTVSATSSPASVASENDNRAVADATAATLPNAGISYLSILLESGGVALLIGFVIFRYKKTY